MSREMRKCVITGDVYPDARKHGYGCPYHSYKEKGLNDQQIVARIAVSSDYPYGGYCCSDCHAIQDLITVPDNYVPSGRSTSPSASTPKRIGLAFLMAVIFAFGFAIAEEPWVLGAIIGTFVGYWFKIVLKIVVVVGVIAVIIAIAAAVLK